MWKEISNKFLAKFLCYISKEGEWILYTRIQKKKHGIEKGWASGNFGGVKGKCYEVEGMRA